MIRVQTGAQRATYMLPECHVCIRNCHIFSKFDINLQPATNILLCPCTSYTMKIDHFHHEYAISIVAKIVLF